MESNPDGASQNLPAEKPLSEEERERLTYLEQGIDRWRAASLEVGRALREIRERRLHRETHRTFAAYCRDRYEIETSQSHRLMAQAWIAEVVEETSPMGEVSVPPPNSERKARSLAERAREADGGEEAARRIWHGLVSEQGGQPASYRDVEEAVKADRENTQKTKPTGEPTGKTVADPQAVLDANKERILGWHCGRFQEMFEELDKDDLPEDGEVKLLLADPPYGVDQRTGAAFVPGGRKLEGDLTPEQAAQILSDMLACMRDKLAADAHVVVFCAPVHEPLMRERVEAEGLDIRSYLVWAKNTHGGGDTLNGLAPSHERAIHATKGNPGLPEGRRPRDVLSHSRVPDTEPHPTRKPAALLRELIEAFTARGDLVADPVGGSGSTLVAAVQRNRRGWGCERDSAFHDAGAARIAEALLQVPPEDEADGKPPARPVAEAPSEMAETVGRHLIASGVGMPAKPIGMPQLARAWILSRREKPKLLVDLFAESAEVGLETALDRDLEENVPLAERVLLIGEEESSKAWETLLDKETSEQTLEGLRYLSEETRAPGKTLSEVLDYDEEKVAPETKCAIRLLLGRGRDRAYRLAALADYRVASLTELSSDIHPPPPMSTTGMREALINTIAELGESGRLVYQRRDCLEALSDPKIAKDPEAAFFVVPPRNVGHHEVLRHLSNVAGDFLAVIEDSSRARVRARERKLDVRKLGSDQVADRDYGQLLLVGKDLSWAGENRG